jgi:transcription elongation factor Elf1
VKFTCPVCGFPSLEEPHVDPTGSPTYSICPCCGVHFGADDVDETHAQLRQKWIDEGAEWWSMNEKAPDGWNAQAQLAAAFGETKKQSGTN